MVAVTGRGTEQVESVCWMCMITLSFMDFFLSSGIYKSANLNIYHWKNSLGPFVFLIL